MKKTFLRTAACIAICMGALSLPCGAAQAQEMGSLPYYAASETDAREHYHTWKVFLEYHLSREQCQGYQAPPPGYVVKNCRLRRIETAQVYIPRQVTQAPQDIAPAAGPLVPSIHTIYFDFDEYDLRDSERQALQDAAADILRYNPATVIVSGHTDTMGTYEYNQTLSEQRASTVADALSGAGVDANVIRQQGYGETQPAVQTGDEVRNQENRRAVIEFDQPSPPPQQP